MYIVKCELCNLKFEHTDRVDSCVRKLTRHLKAEHNTKATAYYKLHPLPDGYADALLEVSRKLRGIGDPTVINAENEALRQSVGDVEYATYATCQECGKVARDLAGHIGKLHDGVEAYKVKFPGVAFRSDDYVKVMSETRKGELNPMFENGSPENSPQAVEFYMKKGFSEEEAIVMKKEFIETQKASRGPESQYRNPAYHTARGYSEEEAIDIVSKLQDNTSIQSIMERRGISLEEATKVREELTEKWMATLDAKSDEEKREILKRKLSGLRSISNASVMFFTNMLDGSGIDSSEVRMEEDELILDYYDEDGKIKFKSYDFTYKNKIIEFHGDKFHANPSMFGPDDKPVEFLNNDYRRFRTAQEIWDRDAHKKHLAESHGYSVFVVWYSDMKQNPIREIRRCREFLSDAIG